MTDLYSLVKDTNAYQTVKMEKESDEKTIADTSSVA